MRSRHSRSSVRMRRECGTLRPPRTEIHRSFETRFVHRGLNRWGPFLLDAGLIGFVPGDARHESRDGFENCFRLMALRRVMAIWKRESLNRSCALLRDSFDLRHGSVLIIDPLDRKYWAGNEREIFFNVPATEAGMKPNVIPSPERARTIAMVSG